jgi:hypothetical protein
MNVIILCILFLIPTALAADKGIFYIQDEKFIDNINELPDSAGNPDKHVQTSGNIEAWVDIVGFKDVVKENETDYVPGNPADYAIVQYDARVLNPMRSRVLQYYTGACYWCSVDSIAKRIKISQHGNQTIANLLVTLHWHETIENSGGSQTFHYTDTAVFQSSEVSPLIYELISELKVNLIQYNNSLYENIGISIANISGLNKYTIQYEDNIATYQIKKAHVEQTAKGIYFANVTPAEFLDLKGKNISRYGKITLLNGNLSKMNLGDIKITGSNLYETKTVNSSQFNITRLEFKPEKELENPVSMWFMSVMGIMVGGIYFCARRMTDQWLRNM